jgi:EamA domain-containing membrane protein RarD
LEIVQPIMTTKDHKGFLLLHLSVFIAGFTGVLGRLIELDPVVLVWHRMTWAAALMALFLLLRKEMRHFRFKDMARMGGVGVLQTQSRFRVKNPA